jgi:citrate lyase subunit beta/citryl-CoA lyase
VPDAADRVRSWLYVPATSGRMLEKAAGSGAGAVLADLEDGVLPEAKDEARRVLREHVLAGHGQHQTPFWVRVNNGPQLDADLDACVLPGVSGICLPKTEDPAQVRRLDVDVRERERELGLEPGGVMLMLLVETAAGVARASECAQASERVLHLQVGEQDLRSDAGLGPETDGDNDTLRTARSLVVLASAAARLRPPVAPVTTQIRDADAVRWTSLRLRAAGFGSRAIIHPAQIAPVHAAYAPTADEVEWARAVVAASAEAAARGAGAATDPHGRMVDEPVLRQARAVLTAALDVPAPPPASPEERHDA